MPFPIARPWTAAQFADLINHYYTGVPEVRDARTNQVTTPADPTSTLRQRILANTFIQATDKAGLVDDYALIGSFLSNPDNVKRALIPLEQSVRQQIAASPDPSRSFPGLGHMPINPADVAALTKRVADSGPAAGIKAGKALSNALRSAEAEAGFNQEKIVQGTLHREIVAQDTKQGTLQPDASRLDPVTGTFQPAGRTPATKTNLPTGVPTVLSQLGGLDGRSFNAILLRHGYQFKDVGAGAYHGEFSHRLQWYAICKGLQGLRNTPLEIYKSLGYMTAKATANVPASRHLYLWEMLFDCGTSDANAIEVSGTLAWCQHTYNSPEVLNTDLMKFSPQITAADESHLWYLRVLLKARWKKRMDNSDLPFFRKVESRLGGPPPGKKGLQTVLSGDMRPDPNAPARPVNTIADAAYALVWYLTT